MSYSVPPKPTPVPFPDNDALRRYRNPEAPLARLFAVLMLPYVLLYAWWAGRKPRLSKRPVAFRVRDYADGWIIYQDERQAYDDAEARGALMQGLYVRDGR